MNKFDEARKEYENIPIPVELGDRVQEGIRQGRTARRTRLRHRRMWLSAAACFTVLAVSLNISPTIAHAAANVPVLGGLFEILTFVSYEKSEDGINYSVDVPQVEAEGDLTEKVNAAIQETMDRHLEQAQKDWDGYREAFFATGGTEEEWNDREMDVIVDYTIKSQTDTQVSFEVVFAECWVAAREERYYYNLDLAENRNITLQDLLGEDWVEISNAAIQAQIDASVDADGFTYFFTPEEGGFTTVDADTAFYIREDGVPVAVFPEYSIAAGAAGCPEFPLQ